MQRRTNYIDSCRIVGSLAVAWLGLSVNAEEQTKEFPRHEQLETEQLDTDLESDKQKLDPVAIEAAGAVIGTIAIKPQNIFDLSDPEEDKLLYRWANYLHIVTRPDIIKSQLLFKEGETFSAQRVDESERVLRRNGYLREADVTPVSYENGVVDLEIETLDVWTLEPVLNLSRKGGENKSAIGLKEDNLLGRGIRLGAIFESSVDRDTTVFDYADNNFLLDHYRLAGSYSNGSDGIIRRFQFGKPFYALDLRRAGGVSLAAGEQIDSLYDRGEIVAEYRNRFTSHQAAVGFSEGLQNGWVRRFTTGVNYEKNEFAPTDDLALPVSILPDDREYLYPFFGVDLFEDRFETTFNFDQIGRTEDRFVGKRYLFQLGYSSDSAGSRANAWHYQGGFSNSLISTKDVSLTIGATLDGRWQDGDAQNTALSGGARFHRRLSEHHLFYASLSGSMGGNLDIDNPLYLGGDSGLRGYPLRYQDGTSLALLTLEHRIYTDMFPLRLVHVGAAIFFDAGRVWGESPVGTPNLGILKDVGFGLRLGNARSGRGKVIHVDISFPLDGEDDINSVQVSVEAKNSF